jgi:hypothetical protein
VGGGDNTNKRSGGGGVDKKRDNNNDVNNNTVSVPTSTNSYLNRKNSDNIESCPFDYRLLTSSSFIKKYLLPCVVNINDPSPSSTSSPFLSLTQFRHVYSGPHHRDIAAVVIQSLVRRFLCRCLYNRISKKGRAATVIQRRYKTYMMRSEFEKRVEEEIKNREKGLMSLVFVRSFCLSVYV